jgi:hypothetical protein
MQGTIWLLAILPIVLNVGSKCQPGVRDIRSLVQRGRAWAHCWGIFDQGDRIHRLDGLRFCEQHARLLGAGGPGSEYLADASGD